MNQVSVSIVNQLNKNMSSELQKNRECCEKCMYQGTLHEREGNQSSWPSYGGCRNSNCPSCHSPEEKKCEHITKEVEKVVTPQGTYSNPQIIPGEGLKARLTQCEKCNDFWISGVNKTGKEVTAMGYSVNVDTPSPIKEMAEEGWSETLQVEVMEEYLQEAKFVNKPFSWEDEATHLKAIQKHFEKLKSFIKEVEQRAYERGLLSLEKDIEGMQQKNFSLDPETVRIGRTCYNIALSDISSLIKSKLNQ